MPLTPPVRQRLLLSGLVLLPALIVYLVLFHEASSVPILDDYNAIVYFSLRWFRQPLIARRLLLILAAQDSDYKLIFEHAILALQISTLHRISLPILIALGDLFLLPMGWVCWRTCFADEPDLLRRLVLFLPVSYLLFQLNYAETLDWTMGALQNVTVVAFSLLAIYLLTRTANAAFPLACLAAACACLSSANGFLLAPVGLLMLLPTRSLPRLVLWIGLFPVMHLLYLFRYEALPAGLQSSLSLKLLFFLSFCGSAFENISGFPITHLAILFGLALLILFLHAAITRYDRQNPAAFYTALWIFLTAALVAAGRSRLGLAQSLSVRYKLYCDLLLIFSYVYVASRIRLSSINTRAQRRLYAVTVVAVLSLSLISDVLGYHFLEKRRQRILLGAEQYSANPAHTTPMINPNDPAATDMKVSQDLARLWLTQAIEAGVYTLPASQAHTPIPRKP